MTTWTDARLELARQMLTDPAVTRREIWCAVNRLPGRPIASARSMAITLKYHGIQRAQPSERATVRAQIGAALMANPGAKDAQIAEALGVQAQRVRYHRIAHDLPRIRDELPKRDSKAALDGPTLRPLPGTGNGEIGHRAKLSPLRALDMPIPRPRACQWPAWPEGARATMRFCDAPLAECGAYCAEHRARAYEPAECAA